MVIQHRWILHTFVIRDCQREEKKRFALRCTFNLRMSKQKTKNTVCATNFSREKSKELLEEITPEEKATFLLHKYNLIV